VVQRQAVGRKAAAAQRAAALKGDRDKAVKALREHAKTCYRCSKAISITGDFCDAGWEMAKAKARAIYAYNNRADTRAGEWSQPELF
jgi:hypothetical protein